MAATRKNASRRARRSVVTTIGDLVSAVYDAVPGRGAARAAWAAAVLTRSALARQLEPQLVLVRTRG